MPTKRLPPSADLRHLKHQAKDLLADFRAARLSAYQRIREFHPAFGALPDDAVAGRPFALSDALLTIAREYGYASWPRLKTVLGDSAADTAHLTHNERITDLEFARALDFLDEGNAAALDAHLRSQPDLVRQRVTFEGENYFTSPTLLEFVAENPVRNGVLPDNIVEIARIILLAGARENAEAVDETLGLVASGRVAREQNAQGPLIDLLCDFGARPGSALGTALAHHEIAAAEHLIRRGAELELPAAAALGREDDMNALAPSASENELQLALALSASLGRQNAVALLLRFGADPNRYNPEEAHSHCTPLHSAAIGGHLETARALVEGGARRDIPDIHHGVTAADWAAHAGHLDVVQFLKGSS